MPADHGVRLSAKAQVVAGQTPERTGSRRARCSARRLRRARRDDALAPLAAADFSSADPDELAARCRIVAVRGEGHGSATRVRRMAGENGRRVLLRAANLDRPGIAVTGADETMIRAVVVFVGRAV